MAGLFPDAGGTGTGAWPRFGGLDPAAFVPDKDSTGYFNGIGKLLPPGSAFTNVTVVGVPIVDTPSI